MKAGHSCFRYLLFLFFLLSPLFQVHAASEMSGNDTSSNEAPVPGLLHTLDANTQCQTVQCLAMKAFKAARDNDKTLFLSIVPTRKQMSFGLRSLVDDGVISQNKRFYLIYSEEGRQEIAKLREYAQKCFQKLRKDFQTLLDASTAQISRFDTREIEFPRGGLADWTGTLEAIIKDKQGTYRLVLRDCQKLDYWYSTPQSDGFAFITQR